MHKEFLDHTTIRNNAIKLAKRIYDDGFIPDVIYCSLRGGAYMANSISEYFKLIKTKNKDSKPLLFAAVVAHSYSDVQAHTSIVIDGWTYSPDEISPDSKILFVDDIFDSGKTINFLVNIFLEKGLPRENIKVVVHDYKCLPTNANLPTQPDYWCRKHEIKSLDEDLWIHYMPHELVGLSDAELEQFYYSEYPDLRPALSIISEINAGKEN